MELPNGIPSHDTFNRFFSNLDPDVLEQQFQIWVKTLCSERTELICIDGKTIRGAKHGGKSLFHMVSAFCHANGVSLAQIRTAEKSNEITAIPELLEVLNLSGCIVSIDAMGCQQGIAETITEREAIRYYISSLDVNAERFNTLIRAHWGIENNLHWLLDVTMGEDASRKRESEELT